MDFAIQDISTTEWVQIYWMAGTLMSSIAMAMAMAYITVEVFD